jgi:hypothetical protein
MQHPFSSLYQLSSILLLSPCQNPDQTEEPIFFTFPSKPHDLFFFWFNTPHEVIKGKKKKT